MICSKALILRETLQCPNLGVLLSNPEDAVILQYENGVCPQLFPDWLYDL